MSKSEICTKEKNWNLLIHSSFHFFGTSQPFCILIMHYELKKAPFTNTPKGLINSTFWGWIYQPFGKIFLCQNYAENQGIFPMLLCYFCVHAWHNPICLSKWQRELRLWIILFYTKRQREYKHFLCLSYCI